MRIFWTKKRGWEIDVTIAGKRVREHGFGKKADVETFFAELKVQAKRGKFGLERDQARVFLRDLVEARVEHIDARNPDGRREIAVLRRFESSFADDFVVNDLQTADIRAYVKARQRRSLAERKKLLAKATVNQDLVAISAMLSRAPEMFPELADWRPPRIPWEPVSRRGRERIITVAERKTLLEALRLGIPGYGRRGVMKKGVEARREAADILELMLHTGMRAIEVRNIKWLYVDFAAAEVHLPKTKNGQPRDIPLNSRALGILRRRQENRRSAAWVFPNMSGTGARSQSSFQHAVSSVAKRLKLHYGRDIEDGFTPHAARHTVATEMFRARQDPSAVQHVLGHSAQTMTLRYTHANRQGMREAVESLLSTETSPDSDLESPKSRQTGRG